MKPNTVAHITKDEIKPGVKFMTRDKHPRLCEVIDVYHTYNLAGELIKTEFVAVHELMGQQVKGKYCAVTIQRGYVAE